VTCWRGLAETVNQYVSKGMQIFVEGEMSGEAADGNLNPRVWTGNDGTPRASFELTARTVKFLGSRGEGGAGAPMGEPPPEGFEEDVLPF
jgi:single-stranded DNA-binding protein